MNKDNIANIVCGIDSRYQSEGRYNTISYIQKLYTMCKEDFLGQYSDKDILNYIIYLHNERYITEEEYNVLLVECANC